MALFPGLLPYWNRQHLMSLVDRVAARVQMAVWHRVRERIPAMGVHEARGYIRARAALVIDQELEIAVVDEPALGPAQLELVKHAVGQQVVRRLLLDNLRRQDPGRVRRRLAA